MAEILIVDDDKVLGSMLTKRLNSIGHNVTCSCNLADGFSEAENGGFDIVFLDVKFPDGNGLDYLTRFTNVSSRPEVIIITGDGDPRGAEKAIKFGAWSYLQKPYVVRDIMLPLTRALEFRKQKLQFSTTTVVLKRSDIIGDSPAINACLEQLANVANGDASVLITGDTGTGKELFAQAVHSNSMRADEPFVIVDCASLPETLIESTLFGHVKGAYTGADKTEGGLVQLANGGTLFLDEVGELPLEVQKKFLRVIQEGRYRPVGSSKELYSNFRVVAATNCDLEQMNQDKMFRTDLLFRLRSFHIHLPPLRERPEDIPLLARHLVSRLCDRLKIEQKVLTSDFVLHLQAQEWRGNVRELFQLLEEVCSKAFHHSTIFVYHLPNHIRINQAQKGLCSNSTDSLDNNDLSLELVKPLPWKEYKAVSEKEYLIQLLKYTGDNIPKACEISGISRARVYQLLKKQGIKLGVM